VRTTLTIDDDVAAALEGLRRTRGVSLKDLINEALRRGLQDLKRATQRRERFATHPVALGRLRIGSLDNISEAPAIAESEGFK
jgi:hypothetical protein